MHACRNCYVNLDHKREGTPEFLAILFLEMLNSEAKLDIHIQKN